MNDSDFQRPQRRWRDKKRELWIPEEDTPTEEVDLNAGLPFARKQRLVIFGGSFNPVHIGHIKLARTVMERDLADEVMFIPAKQSPLKEADQASNADIRMEMLQLAVDDALKEKSTFTITAEDGTEEVREYRFSISDLELRREGAKTYTIDTLDTLRRVYPDTHIIFLMGSDCLDELNRWHRYGELLRQYDFLVYPRPGQYLELLKHRRKAGVGGPNLVLRELLPIFGEYFAVKLDKALSALDTVPVWDISSTDIRQAVHRGGDLAPYLTPSVWKYICDHKLYM